MVTVGCDFGTYLLLRADGVGVHHRDRVPGIPRVYIGASIQPERVVNG